MKVMIAAGGTGGHVYPALAVAEVLRARGHEVVWLGTPDSFEARVVPRHGIGVETVRVSGLRGQGLRRWFAAPLTLLRALRQARGILRRQRPAVVLGMGGYAAGPGGFAAWLAGIPLVIHEQNAVAGYTNRWLAPLARRVLEAFPGTFGEARTVGNPVRGAIAALADPGVRYAGRSGAARLLVLGGSQGARALNETVPAALALLPEDRRPQVRHQAGRTLELAQRAYGAAGVVAEVNAFIEDMASAYGWADLVICRAGASTVAELAAAGCAALLVPYPHAVDDHQTRNAQYLVRAGAALLLPQAQLTAPRLAELLGELLVARDRLVAMAQAARRAAWPNAAVAIADACLECAA
ncbi:MAG: undecaprenyldiphospho-muramoylpentapeptide beta-N-acetylglucosaminyltransferase [Fulvimonas sp.]|nr:undecaprenyldiphospho-muramoylpentapeptide beta-N-acetylglucosaminyltransferase [Nevskia sp.]MDI3262282.1 undecaprenyldiphospho-muramoylpentapeptide beta-N-acetylglucosaminyltransferase [Fulvimonas sp.]